MIEQRSRKRDEGCNTDTRRERSLYVHERHWELMSGIPRVWNRNGEVEERPCIGRPHTQQVAEKRGGERTGTRRQITKRGGGGRGNHGEG